MFSAHAGSNANSHPRLRAFDVLKPNWLRPGAVNAGQQAFGDALLDAEAFTVLPSVVSSHSWNVLFDPARAAGLYGGVDQEVFALDTRLDPVTPP